MSDLPPDLISISNVIIDDIVSWDGQNPHGCPWGIWLPCGSRHESVAPRIRWDFCLLGTGFPERVAPCIADFGSRSSGPDYSTPKFPPQGHGRSSKRTVAVPKYSGPPPPSFLRTPAILKGCQARGGMPPGAIYRWVAAYFRLCPLCSD